MRKLLSILSIVVFALIAYSCSSDDNWDKYENWREANETWLNEQAKLKNADGTPYYTKIVPSWDKNTYVLIKYFNDTTLTQNNLKPFYTSTIDVKYKGRLYNDEAFDSSYLSTSPADSIYRNSLSSVIGGWAIALTQMHIGDSCQIVVPYQSAYGSSGYNSIDPYSNLVFNIKLVGIPGLVIPVD